MELGKWIRQYGRFCTSVVGCAFMWCEEVAWRLKLLGGRPSAYETLLYEPTLTLPCPLPLPLPLTLPTAAPSLHPTPAWCSAPCPSWPLVSTRCSCSRPTGRLRWTPTTWQASCTAWRLTQ